MIFTELSTNIDSHIASRALYVGASQVFRSLPPVELVLNFNQERYDSWYSEHFTDSSDGWNDGPLLHVHTRQDGAIDLQFITPTSGRQVRIIVSGDEFSRRIIAAWVVFPRKGSKYAASEVARLTRIELEKQLIGLWDGDESEALQQMCFNEQYHLIGEGWSEMPDHAYIMERDLFNHSFAAFLPTEEGEMDRWFHDQEHDLIYDNNGLIPMKFLLVRLENRYEFRQITEEGGEAILRDWYKDYPIEEVLIPGKRFQSVQEAQAWVYAENEKAREQDQLAHR